MNDLHDVRGAWCLYKGHRALRLFWGLICTRCGKAL